MEPHRMLIVGLILAFFMVVGVDYWRKRKPRP